MKQIYLFMFFVLILSCSERAFSQWKRTNGPIGHHVYTSDGGQALFAHNEILLSATDSGVYQITDKGMKWVPNILSDSGWFTSFVELGTLIFAGGENGIWRSSDEGVTWKAIGYGREITGLAVLGSTLFFSSARMGVQSSADSGTTSSIVSPPNGRSRYFSVWTAGSILYVESDIGPYRSSNEGQSWEFDTTGVGLAGFGQLIFSGSGKGVFRSVDGGETWMSVIGKPIDTASINSILVRGSVMFAGGNSGVFRSVDTGKTWVEIGKELPREQVYQLAVSSGFLYAGTKDSDVWRYSLSDFSQVKNFNDQVNISLSPNPTTGIITVHSSSANIVHVTVSSILGEIVIELAQANASEFTLDLSKPPPGIYVARFALAGEVITRKILKE